MRRSTRQASGPIVCLLARSGPTTRSRAKEEMGEAGGANPAHPLALAAPEEPEPEPFFWVDHVLATGDDFSLPLILERALSGPDAGACARALLVCKGWRPTILALKSKAYRLGWQPCLSESAFWGDSPIRCAAFRLTSSPGMRPLVAYGEAHSGFGAGTVVLHDCTSGSVLCVHNGDRSYRSFDDAMNQTNDNLSTFCNNAYAATLCFSPGAGRLLMVAYFLQPVYAEYMRDCGGEGGGRGFREACRRKPRMHLRIWRVPEPGGSLHNLLQATFRTFRGHENEDVVACCFGPEGTDLGFSLGRNATVWAFSTADGSPIRMLLPCPAVSIGPIHEPVTTMFVQSQTTLSLSPLGKRLCIGSSLGLNSLRAIELPRARGARRRCRWRLHLRLAAIAPSNHLLLCVVPRRPLAGRGGRRPHHGRRFGLPRRLCLGHLREPCQAAGAHHPSPRLARALGEPRRRDQAASVCCLLARRPPPGRDVLARDPRERRGVQRLGGRDALRADPLAHRCRRRERCPEGGSWSPGCRRATRVGPRRCGCSWDWPRFEHRYRLGSRREEGPVLQPRPPGRAS